ncbi:MAG TPA: HAMP domain-containing protein, partial [Lysobacter sp.]
MSVSRHGSWSRWLPRTMASRLYLILFSGLLIAYGLSFGMTFYERYESATSMLMTNLEQDVVVAVKLLDRLPPQEREHWVPMLKRRTFRYMMGEGQGGRPVSSETARGMTQMLADALGPEYPIEANVVSEKPERFQVHLHLSDGTPMVVEVQPSVMPAARWLPYVLAAQLGLLLLITWAAVRLATRPLQRLADAAEALSPAGDGERLREGGPLEVANAVTAFNTMQDRIAQYMKDRLQILAAISHDLQTPITRM